MVIITKHDDYHIAILDDKRWTVKEIYETRFVVYPSYETGEVLIKWYDGRGLTLRVKYYDLLIEGVMPVNVEDAINKLTGLEVGYLINDRGGSDKGIIDNATANTADVIQAIEDKDMNLTIGNITGGMNVNMDTTPITDGLYDLGVKLDHVALTVDSQTIIINNKLDDLNLSIADVGVKTELGAAAIIKAIEDKDVCCGSPITPPNAQTATFKFVDIAGAETTMELHVQTPGDGLPIKTWTFVDENNVSTNYKLHEHVNGDGEPYLTFTFEDDDPITPDDTFNIHGEEI